MPKSPERQGATGVLLLGAFVAGVVVNEDRAPVPQAARERTPEPVDSATRAA
ncbi:hypothetical protein ABT075_04365 [Streptomyces sp. NPDC002677]|uniref:hypothetical protein n=1 Tax=Streptomyces sp. NPDC002677 TaxID=3154774 RepID=UPI003325E4A3